MTESKEALSKQKPKILFIGTDWSQNEYRKINNKPGAISTYRLIYPMRYLPYDIDYLGSDFGDKINGKDKGTAFYDLFSQYDLVVSKITDNATAVSDISFITKYLEIPLIVDIDDNIWEIKEDQPAYKIYYKGGPTLGFASTYVSNATAVFCSTKPLADYIQNRMKDLYNEDKPVYVLPNCTDPIDWKFKKAKLDDSKIVIGWQGSTTHHEDLKIAMPAISKLMIEYPNLYLELLGGVSDEMVADLFKGVDESVLDRVQTKGGVPAFDTFPHLMSEQAWDIAIAPITDEPFNHSKSHIKWMEYAMYEIPCIASNVYPYRESIQGTDVIVNRETGILSKDNEWYDNLKLLIDNKDLRLQIGKNAKEYVTKEWHIKKHIYKWKDVIDTLLKSSS